MLHIALGDSIIKLDDGSYSGFEVNEFHVLSGKSWRVPMDRKDDTPRRGYPQTCSLSYGCMPREKVW